MKRLCIALLLLTRVASAEPTDAERALATKLFKEAKALMADGKYAAACPKLEESQRLDPGGGTILNLAMCREEEGRTATAWTLFHEALAYAKRDGRTDRRELAEQHIAALEPKLAYVKLNVNGDVSITIDKVSIAKAAWDAPIPIDPGEHRIEASAPGKLAYVTTTTTTPGTTTPIAIEPLVDAPVPPPAPVIAPPQPPPPKPRVVDTPSYTGAYIATGFSAVAFAATGYFALRATSERHKSDNECVHGCTDAGVTYNDRAKTFADVGTVTFTIGAVALATAVVLYVIPPRSHTTIGIGPTSARFTVYF